MHAIVRAHTTHTCHWFDACNKKHALLLFVTLTFSLIFQKFQTDIAENQQIK